MLKLVLATMTVALSALSATQPNPELSKIQKFTKVVIEESRMNRDEKRHSVLTNIGIHHGLRASRGIGYEHFLSGDKLITANISFEDHSTGGSFYKTTKGSAVSVGYKQFNGNSFYFHGGLFTKQINIRENDYYNVNTGKEFNLNAKVSYSGAYLKIGNQWQWDDFTIGCDWIGLASVVGKDELAIEELDDRTLSEANSITALNFYIGASF